MKPIIEVDQLSKFYRLGVIGTSTLSDTVQNWTKRLFSNKEGTVLTDERVQMVNPRATETTVDPNTLWALKDVSFTVDRGEIVGIIGKNGAGKSTLLKILTRITDPTSGRAVLRGRVASLLEVGTGFHPELTGRENVFLNGAILGMRKSEITKKFDEIVAFSEVEKFIDTPVKRYSSGMYVRLAFSVAAHLEPEILLVDEVLAVGDVAFQKKCLGKMNTVAKEGRTVLFVSHNMAAIRNICDRSILIDHGELIVDSDTQEVVAKYLNLNLIEGAKATSKDFEGKIEGRFDHLDPSFRLDEVALYNQAGELSNHFYSDEEIKVSIKYECLRAMKNVWVTAHVVDEENRSIIATQNMDDEKSVNLDQQKAGMYQSSFTIPANTLGEKVFYLSIWIQDPKTEHLVVNKVLKFNVKFVGLNKDQATACKDSYIRQNFEWHTEFKTQQIGMLK